MGRQHHPCQRSTGNGAPGIVLGLQPQQAAGEGGNQLPPAIRRAAMLTAATLPLHRCPVPTGALRKPLVAGKTTADRTRGEGTPRPSPIRHAQGSPSLLILFFLKSMCIQHRFLGPSSQKNSHPCAKLTCSSLVEPNPTSGGESHLPSLSDRARLLEKVHRQGRRTSPWIHSGNLK